MFLKALTSVFFTCRHIYETDVGKTVSLRIHIGVSKTVGLTVNIYVSVSNAVERTVHESTSKTVELTLDVNIHICKSV